MERDKKLIVLLLGLAIVSYLIFYYIYSDWFLISFLKKQGIDSNVGCFNYHFISAEFDELNNNYSSDMIYTKEKLKLREKVTFLRKLQNQKYRNFIKFGKGVTRVCYYNGSKYQDFCSNIDIGQTNGSRMEYVNITNSRTFFIEFMGDAMYTNIAEIMYAISKDVMSQKKPKDCNISEDNVDVGRVLVTSVSMAEQGILSTFLSNLFGEGYGNNTSCVKNDICAKEFLNKLDKKAEKLKTGLENYTKVGVQQCPNNQAYLIIKGVEKEMRKDLITIKDPVSKIFKIIFIDSYDFCAEKILKQEEGCSIVPKNTIDSIKEIMLDMGVFTNCTVNHLRNQTRKGGQPWVEEMGFDKT